MNIRFYVFLLIGGLAGSAAAEPPAKPEILVVGYLPATHDSLLFIAMERGFFPPQLTVELAKYSSSPDILNDMRSEKVDLGIPGVAAPINFIAGGAPFKIVGGAAQESAAVVVAPKFQSRFAGPRQSLDSKMKQFAGMRIGSVRQSTGDALFRKAIQDHKVGSVDLNDSYRDPKVLLSDLLTDKVDGAVLWSPHMTTAEAQGMPVVLWLGEVLPKHVCCRQVVRARYLAAHEDAVVMYLEGLIRAMAFYNNPKNHDAVMAAVGKYVLNPPEVLEQELYNQRRTKLSVDINAGGIQAYVDAMQTFAHLDSTQLSDVSKSIETAPLYRAYKNLLNDDGLARKAVSQGFDSVKEQLQATLVQ